MKTSKWEKYFLLFSIVGSYESTNCPSTNCILRDDLPIKIKYILNTYLNKYTNVSSIII